MKNYCLVIFRLLFNSSYGQVVIGSCFASVKPTTDFISSILLVNNDPNESELMEWTVTNRIGYWSSSHINISTPGNVVGSRATFVESGTTWTTDGEGFCLFLNSPLATGRTYSFDFTYVSHGFESDGNFPLFFHTNNTPTIVGAYHFGSLSPAGHTWSSSPLTFTANASKSGHTWIAIRREATESSGLIDQLCSSQNVACSIQIGNDTTLCQGETLTLDAMTPNATYLLQDNSSDPTFNATQQGTSWVEITTNCRSTSDTINANFNTLPPIDLGNETNLYQGESITLDVTTPNTTYLWHKNSTNPTLNVTQQGTYWIKTKKNSGIDSDTIIVGLENSTCRLYIPNSFTPNFDNKNDQFSPLFDCEITEYSFLIFNHWGKLIFETNIQNNSWNGNFKREICPTGIYIYMIKYQYEEKYQKKYGHVSLLK